MGTHNEGNSRLFLTKNSISHILLCAPEVEQTFPNSYQYKLIPLLNIKAFNPIEHFDHAADYIYEAMTTGTGCLVHDFKGDSRTLGCIISYLIKYRYDTYDDAIKRIKTKKKDAHVNNHYSNMLKDYQNSVDDRRNKGTLFPPQNVEDQEENGSQQGNMLRTHSSANFRGEKIPQNAFIQERDLPEMNKTAAREMNRTGSSFNKSKYKWENFEKNDVVSQGIKNVEFDAKDPVVIPNELSFYHNGIDVRLGSRGRDSSIENAQTTEQRYLEGRLKTMSKTSKEANVISPVMSKVFVLGNDQFRSKHSRGQYMEDCNTFDDRVNDNTKR